VAGLVALPASLVTMPRLLRLWIAAWALLLLRLHLFARWRVLASVVSAVVCAACEVRAMSTRSSASPRLGAMAAIR
jgi:hypothetical protein